MSAKSLRRGKVEVEEVRERDPDGKIVVHHRAVDAIGRLFRSGVIDEPMLEAAREFQTVLAIANLETVRALPMPRIPGSLRQWALRQRWRGRAARPDRAQGMLVAALSVLAGRRRGGDI